MPGHLAAPLLAIDRANPQIEGGRVEAGRFAGASFEEQALGYSRQAAMMERGAAKAIGRTAEGERAFGAGGLAAGVGTTNFGSWPSAGLRGMSRPGWPSTTYLVSKARLKGTGVEDDVVPALQASSQRERLLASGNLGPIDYGLQQILY